MIRLRHARAELALHPLKEGDGLPLLLLHELYGSSADWGEIPAAWHGSVYGLDFSGHGGSDWLTGGGYMPEMLVADADAALQHIGSAAVAGAGLGAYVALLLTGSRREDVPAVLLLPGAGLSGAGSHPDPQVPFLSYFRDESDIPPGAACDPLVRLLESDVRPVEYAEAFARATSHLLMLEDAALRAPWWNAVRELPAVDRVSTDAGAAFARLAQIVRRLA